MRLSSDDEVEAMTMEELQSKMSLLHEDCTQFDTVEELRERFKRLQRTRSLALWHDHATLLGLGTVMFTVHVVYDPAVFYTQSEIEVNGSRVDSINLQSTIERPVIHMIAAGSSSIEDQASLLQDRIDWLHSLSENITTSSGITITDRLCFFIGDQQAQQFERDTQLGGR